MFFLAFKRKLGDVYRFLPFILCKYKFLSITANFTF